MTFKKDEFYPTVDQAKDLIPGFRLAFGRFEEHAILNGLRSSLVKNNGRNVAHLTFLFDIYSIQHLLGHSHFRTTIIYLHVAQIIEYLGRYTHKIAISNHRITDIENGKVSFSYKDYKDNGKTKEMNLEAEEFIRRFTSYFAKGISKNPSLRNSVIEKQTKTQRTAEQDGSSHKKGKMVLSVEISKIGNLSKPLSLL